MTEQKQIEIYAILLPIIGKEDANYVRCAIRSKMRRESQKSAHPNYASCIKLYDDFVKSKGFNPKITAADGKAMNELISFFESFESVKSGTHTLESCFDLIFSNWEHLTPFLQSQINLRQINSYINNILDGIRNNKKQLGDSKMDKRIADKFAQSQHI